MSSLTDGPSNTPHRIPRHIRSWIERGERLLKRRGVESTLLHVLAFAICFSIYTSNVSGFKSATQAVSADILNLMFANFYPSKRRDDIVVVVATDADIDHFGDQFPISYSLHETVLSRLESLQPKALLVDFVFAREQLQSERSDANRFAEFLKGYSIPLFLATGESTVERPNGVHPKFEAGTLVAVPRFLSLSKRGLYCFFHRDSVTNGAPASETPGCTDDGTGPRVRPTAALAIYDAVCGAGQPSSLCPPDRELRPFRDNYLRIIWGGDASELFDFIPERSPCVRTPWWEMMRPDEETVAADCPYHPQITVLELLTAANDRALRDRLVEAMRGKIVVYGGFVGPSPDVIRPPTVRGIPGGHMHAMALDNLLTYGNGYKSDVTEIGGLPIKGSLVNVVFMLLSYLLAVARDARVTATKGRFDPLTSILTVSTIGFYTLFCWFSFAILDLAPSNWVGAAITTVVLPALLRDGFLRVRSTMTGLYHRFRGEKAA